MSYYSELIAWDRKRNARPIVFGHDEADTGSKTTEEDKRYDY